MSRISHSLIKTLRHVPAFASLSDVDLIHILGLSANLHWPAGSIVFRRGTEAEALYIVLSGRIRIFETIDGAEVDVASIGRGDFFGELSLLRDETHSKSAEALEESELMVIPKERFRGLLVADTSLAEHVNRKMEERLKANAAPLS